MMMMIMMMMIIIIIIIIHTYNKEFRESSFPAIINILRDHHHNHTYIKEFRESSEAVKSIYKSTHYIHLQNTDLY
jgi:hypothetical protein